MRNALAKCGTTPGQRSVDGSYMLELRAEAMSWSTARKRVLFAAPGACSAQSVGQSHANAVWTDEELTGIRSPVGCRRFAKKVEREKAACEGLEVVLRHLLRWFGPATFPSQTQSART